MIRFLTFSGLLALLLTSCGTYRYPNQLGVRNVNTTEVNTYFTDTAQAFVYRARVQAFQKDLNGNLLIKTISPETHRIALVSDLGQTLFDMSIFPENHVLHFIMPDLDNKRVAKEIAFLFRTLTQRQFSQKAITFSGKQAFPVYVVNNAYYAFEERNLADITSTKGKQELLLIHFDSIKQAIPGRIDIEHKRLPIRISLALDRERSEIRTKPIS